MSNADVAARFGADEGTVRRARKSGFGPHGGVPQELPIDQIVVDHAYQVRDLPGGIDREHVEQLAEAYREGREVPPVAVTPRGGRYVLVAGFHRYEAAVAAGLGRLDVEVVQGSEVDLFAVAIRSNVGNGLQFRKRDRTRSARLLLARFPELLQESNVALGRRFGLSEGTFRNIRRELDAQVPVGRPEGEPEVPAAGATPWDDEPDDDGEPEGPGPAADAGEEAPEVVFHRQRHPALESLSADQVQYLITCPAFLGLAGEPLGTFVHEYLYRERMADALRAFRAEHLRRRPRAKVQPVLAAIVEMLFNVRTPADLRVCPECGGEGCDLCRKRGYK